MKKNFQFYAIQFTDKLNFPCVTTNLRLSNTCILDGVVRSQRNYYQMIEKFKGRIKSPAVKKIIAAFPRINNVTEISEDFIKEWIAGETKSVISMECDEYANLILENGYVKCDIVHDSQSIFKVDATFDRRHCIKSMIMINNKLHSEVISVIDNDSDIEEFRIGTHKRMREIVRHENIASKNVFAEIYIGKSKDNMKLYPAMGVTIDKLTSTVLGVPVKSYQIGEYYKIEEYRDAWAVILPSGSCEKSNTVFENFYDALTHIVAIQNGCDKQSAAKLPELFNSLCSTPVHQWGNIYLSKDKINSIKM